MTFALLLHLNNINNVIKFGYNHYFISEENKQHTLYKIVIQGSPREISGNYNKTK